MSVAAQSFIWHYDDDSLDLHLHHPRRHSSHTEHPMGIHRRDLHIFIRIWICMARLRKALLERDRVAGIQTHWRCGNGDGGMADDVHHRLCRGPLG